MWSDSKQTQAVVTWVNHYEELDVSPASTSTYTWVRSIYKAWRNTETCTRTDTTNRLVLKGKLTFFFFFYQIEMNWHVSSWSMGLFTYIDIRVILTCPNESHRIPHKAQRVRNTSYSCPVGISYIWHPFCKKPKTFTAVMKLKKDALM